MIEHHSPLLAPTPPGWVTAVLGDFLTFLSDHAACERKAASLCLSLVGRCPEEPQLVEPLVTLAREEMEHFQQVYRLLIKSGGRLLQETKDPYVNALAKAQRHGPDVFLLDRLVIAGLIEARGTERFALLAEALPDAALRRFYDTLARSEAGHYRVFLRIAERLFARTDVAAALARLAPLEAEVMLACPLRAAVH